MCRFSLRQLGVSSKSAVSVDPDDLFYVYDMHDLLQ